MVGLLRTPLLNCDVDLMCPLCCVENKEILNPESKLSYKNSSFGP